MCHFVRGGSSASANDRWDLRSFSDFSQDRTTICTQLLEFAQHCRDCWLGASVIFCRTQRETRNEKVSSIKRKNLYIILYILINHTLATLLVLNVIQSLGYSNCFRFTLDAIPWIVEECERTTCYICSRFNWGKHHKNVTECEYALYLLLSDSNHYFIFLQDTFHRSILFTCAVHIE